MKQNDDVMMMMMMMMVNILLSGACSVSVNAWIPLFTFTTFALVTCNGYYC